MAKLLVVYGTHDGQTALIAHRMADVLRSRGHSVDIRDARALPSSFSPRVFEGVLVGSSVRWGRHQPSVREFARQHAAALDRLPSWFFSVSLAAADPVRGRVRAGERVREFGHETGWWPERTQVFAGALRYTAYGVFLRLVMCAVAFFAKLPTNSSLDHDLTDWTGVRSFVRDFDLRLAPPFDESAERGELQPLPTLVLGTRRRHAADAEGEATATAVAAATTAPELRPVGRDATDEEEPAREDQEDQDSEAETEVRQPVHH